MKFINLHNYEIYFIIINIKLIILRLILNIIHKKYQLYIGF